MFKIGDKVEHFKYGKGEIISIDKKTEFALVSFDTEHEIVIHDVIDEPYYFEDNTRVEITNTISVFEGELSKLSGYVGNNKGTYINHCHSCKKLISSQTHSKCEECNWFKCECGSCRCNYKGKHKLIKSI